MKTIEPRRSRHPRDVLKFWGDGYRVSFRTIRKGHPGWPGELLGVILISLIMPLLILVWGLLIMGVPVEEKTGD